MTRLIAAVMALCSWSALAAEHACEIPSYLLLSQYELKRVNASVLQHQQLTIAVLGTGSSMLAGPDGPRSAYPARLEAALKKRLPAVSVKLVSLVRSRQTSEELAAGMQKWLGDEKPDLVIWQCGTVDAMRHIEPEEFREALDKGLDVLNRNGVDAVLMNMQYSPRTETMIGVGPYADTMRVVAQQHEVPLFDRLSIMRHWSDTGEFDLYATGKDNVLAAQVHDCIGRGIATMIMDAAHLDAPHLAPQQKPPQ
jgi:lysophospholipase L1-like esterase